MSSATSTALNPVAAFVSAARLWIKNFIPIVAIYAVNVFALRVFQLSLRCASPVPPGSHGAAVAVMLGFEALLVIALGSFISLLVIFFLKDAGSGRADISATALRVGKAFGCYFSNVLLLLSFFIVGLLIAGAFLAGGHLFYVLRPGALFSLMVLLTTSTVAVALGIAVVWYGFYFTLAPLIAAFENVRPIQAFRESRVRIRGNALRFGLMFAAFVALYMALGLFVYFVLRSAAVDRKILYAIDPAMGALFGPLWLALWLVAYEKLKVKKTSNAR